MALTDAKVRALKAKAAPYKLSDGESLYVLVTIGGSKLWNLAYRFNGKQKTLALGKYPAVSLLEARRARDAAKQLLLMGTDPSADRKAARRKKSIAAANIFGAVAEEWFEINKGRWVESYSSRLRSRLDDDLLPALATTGPGQGVGLFVSATSRAGSEIAAVWPPKRASTGPI
jgi:hypothetical protein